MAAGVATKAAVAAPLTKSREWRLNSARSPGSEHGPEHDPQHQIGNTAGLARRFLQRIAVGSSNGGLGEVDIPQTQSPRPTPSYGTTTASFTPEGGSRIHSSPERLRRTNSELLNRVPEDGAMEFPSGETPRYLGGALLHDEDEEDSDWELEEELEEQGLYHGSYKSLVLLHTLVPITSVIAFICLAILPSVAYPTDPAAPLSPYPYAPYLPFPVPELLASIAFWSFAHTLRDPLYSLALFLSSPFPAISSAFSILFSTFGYAILSIACRQVSIPILLIPHDMLYEYPTWRDPAFRRVWWVALGWAAAESCVAIRQGYEGIALYRDVMVTVKHNPGHGLEVLGDSGKLFGVTERRNGYGGISRESMEGSPETIVVGNPQTHRAGPDIDSHSYMHAPHGAEGEQRPLLPRMPSQTSQDLQVEEAALEVDRDLDRLVDIKHREELEEVYGMPVIRIPVFISCLQRVNTVILSLGITLLLSSAYIRSTFAIFMPVSSPTNSYDLSMSSIYPLTSIPLRTSDHASKSNTHLAITLPLIFVLQLLLGILHTPLILPRIGIHTAVYIGLLASLGAFFAGLSVWEALS